VIIFGSVRFLSKKVIKPKFKKKPKPNQNRVKPTGFVSVRFGFLGQNRFKPVWLVFSGFGSVFSVLALFFSVLARFFWFGSVFPVWLGFFFDFLSVSVQFDFLIIKPKPNRTGRFCHQIMISRAMLEFSQPPFHVYMTCVLNEPMIWRCKLFLFFLSLFIP